MDTEQARRLITLHDNADRALLNLRNAGAMSTDDPRATELLEEAGDAYVAAYAALFDSHVPFRPPAAETAAVASGKAPGAETPAAGVQQAERPTNAQAPATGAVKAPVGDPKGRDEGTPSPAA